MRLSTKNLFGILLFLGIFIMTLRPALDPDLWWHLRTGEWILAHGIPQQDPFSHVASGLPWITHEWLSEVLLQLAYQAGGLRLLVLLFSGMLTGAYLLVYKACPADSRPYAAGFALILAALASAPLWGVRPQMITLFLFCVFFFFLERFRVSGRPQELLPLPFLMVLWANLHAGYLVGLALLGTYALSLLLKRQPGIPRLSVRVDRAAAWLLATLGGCILATLLNPSGYRILLYPFETLSSQSMMAFIHEWFSPDFHRLEWLPLAVLLLATAVAGYLGRQEVPGVHLLLLVGGGLAGLRSMRHVPLFSVLAVPLLARQVRGLAGLRLVSRPVTRTVSSINLLVLVLVILAGGLQISSITQRQTESIQELYPAQAVDWINANQPQGRLYNTYRWGGYLLWRLYPEYQVFIDGRADVYGDGLIAEYLDIYSVQPGWEAELTARDVRMVLIEPGEPLALALEGNPAWELAYQDAQSVLFVRR